MSDLISRQAALDTIEWTWAGKAAFDALKALPSVDAVEIVRCRDCKHNPNDTWFECPISHLPYDEDRWCWKGEKKDG